MASTMSCEPGIFEVITLRGWPHEDAAENYLRDIAEAVSPIMSRREWNVDFLDEFYPDDDETLVSSKSNGQTICLRLRDSRDHKGFNPFGLMVDAMLHELAHRAYVKHGRRFQELWDELRYEYLGDNCFQGLSRISHLPDPLESRSMRGVTSANRSLREPRSSGRAPSTVRTDTMDWAMVNASSKRESLSTHMPPLPVVGPLSTTETCQSRPPSSYRSPQSARGRSRSRIGDTASSAGHPLQVQQHVQMWPPSVVPPSMRGPSTRISERGPTSSRPPSVVPPSMRAPSSRVPPRGPTERTAFSRPPSSRLLQTERGAPPSYRSPARGSALKISNRTYQAPSMTSSVAHTDGSPPAVRSPPSERTTHADNRPMSIRSWADSITPRSVRQTSTLDLPLVRVPTQRATSRVPSHAHSRAPSHAPSEGLDSVRTLSELMPSDQSNYERALQRRGESWYIRQLAEAREREVTEHAARERQAAECAMHQRLTYENYMVERSMHDRMTTEQAAASRRHTESRAPSQVVAMQQVTMGIGGMGLSVNQSVPVTGDGSMRGSVSLDAGRVVHGGPGGGCRTLRRTGRRRRYSSSAS